MIPLACHRFSFCDPDDKSYQGTNEISINRFLSLGQLAKLVRLSSVQEVKAVVFIPI